MSMKSWTGEWCMNIYIFLGHVPLVDPTGLRLGQGPVSMNFCWKTWKIYENINCDRILEYKGLSYPQMRVGKIRRVVESYAATFWDALFELQPATALIFLHCLPAI